MKPIRKTIAALAIFAAALIASLPVYAGALTDYAENHLIDWLLRGQAFTPVATQGIALGTNTCSDSGSPTEPDDTYTRQSVTAGLAAWAGTQGAGTTVASTGTGGTTSNNNIISWTESTAAWSASTTLKSVWIMDSTTTGAGNVIICIDLTTPFAVTGAGVTVRLPAAALQYQQDN